MMTEKIETAIEELENNGYVIKNVMFADGTRCHIEFADDKEIVAVEIIPLEKYEDNGFSDNGLTGEWIQF